MTDKEKAAPRQECSLQNTHVDYTPEFTADNAQALLSNYPCCFLYEKGETKPDGKTATGKDPKGLAWPKNPRRPEHWKPGVGIGVICGAIPEGFPAAGLAVHCLDVDARHAPLAERYRDYLNDYLAAHDGDKLSRVGKPPKFLMPFTCKEELQKSDYTTKKYYPTGVEKSDADANQLEVLGAGNQFVAYATHPDTGKPYQWGTLDGLTLDDSLHATRPANLVELSREDLAEISAAFKRLAGEHGLVLEPTGPGNGSPLPAPPPEAWVDGSAPGEGGYTLAEVLPFLRNNGVDYDEWQKVGAAIKTAGGTYDDWLSYSRQCAEKHDETDMPKKWASFKDKPKGARMGTLARMAIANGMKSRKEQRQQKSPLPPKTPIASVFKLPAYPAELADLPYELGELQAFIGNRMTYPSIHMAGITALATLTAFAQKNITINSRDGLGFNEYYMILAPTGFGKEDIRKPLEILDKLADDAMTPEIVAEAGGGNLSGMEKTVIRHAAPASAQGTHVLLEDSHSVFFLSDEFAEWLRASHGNDKRQEALGYLMQAYTKATGTIEPGNAVTNKYKPVKNPRLSVMATSTAAAMFETLSREQADSGAYNRWVIHAGDEELPQKRYTGLVYEPAQPLLNFIAWVKAIPPGTRMKFSAEAFKAFIALDSELAEPVKRKDGILGGRLAEQSIKMAGLIALAARRLTIEPDDLKTAFNIRVGLYQRASALARHEGSLEGLHATGKALEQVAEVFRREPSVYRSQLPALSRRYKSLSLPERKAVVEALIAEGIAEPHLSRKAVLHSLVFEGK